MSVDYIIKAKFLRSLGKVGEAKTYTDKALKIDPNYAGESINKLVTSESAI